MKINFFSDNKNVLSYLFTILCVLGLVIIFGWAKHTFFPGKRAIALVPIRENQREFNLISPLLAIGDSPSLRRYNSLEQKISDLIEKSKEAHKIDSASLYFRDINTSQWMGVNENEKYSPASMYKVALMIAYFKSADRDSSILSENIVYKGIPDEAETQNEIDSQKLEIGKSYTISELIRRMIVYSANDATYILQGFLDSEAKKKVFSDLGLSMPGPNDVGDTMSVKSFSLFFRILYNASYLPEDMSEKALEILSKTDFKEGIVAGVPQDMSVAHKFGYRFLASSTGEKVQELHDCGLVYYPQHPYFLCVMTRGQNDQNLKAIIQDISRMVYTNVGSDYSK